MGWDNDYFYPQNSGSWYDRFPCLQPRFNRIVDEDHATGGMRQELIFPEKCLDIFSGNDAMRHKLAIRECVQEELAIRP